MNRVSPKPKTARTTGYSGTPLAQKLGIKPGTRLYAKNAPPDYRKLLGPLPEDIAFLTRPGTQLDLIHLFVRTRAELAQALARFDRVMPDDGMIWVSWPKKASGVQTDVTEDTIREVALPKGLVDVKVCAVDATWSGLKLVRRRVRRSG